MQANPALTKTGAGFPESRFGQVPRNHRPVVPQRRIARAWQFDGGNAVIHLGDTAKVSITVADGGWTRLLKLPKVTNLTIIRMGQEEIEGTQEHPIVISRFSVLPSQTGDFTIPAFDIKTQTSEILHVQAFTLHVFAPDQNIPPQLLVAQNQGANISPPPPPAAPPETLTVLSATTGKVVKVIHYSSAGVPIDQSASPATSLSTSPTPSNSGQPAPDSSAPAPPNPSGVTGTSVVTSQSGVPGNQPFDDKTPLDVVEDGASKANPEAEYQFAERLLSAAARSPGAVKLLDEEATDYFNYYNSHPGPYYMDIRVGWCSQSSRRVLQ